METPPTPIGSLFEPTDGAAARAPTGGFSLVEVVMATMVMTLGLGSAIIGLQIGMRHLDLARTSTAVSQALQNEAERLRLMNWTAISGLPEVETIDQATTFSTEAILNGRLTMTRAVRDVDGFEDMKEIVLQGQWTSMDGRKHTRIYHFRYGKGGLYDYYYSSAGGI